MPMMKKQLCTTQQYTHHRKQNIEESNQLPHTQLTTQQMDQPLHPMGCLAKRQAKTCNLIRLRIRQMTTDLEVHNNQPETNSLFTSIQQQIIQSVRYHKQTAEA
jgi:hypothetical protein